MKKFFKVILTVLFWQTIYFLSIFYIPETYYTHWFIGFIIFFMIVLVLAIRFIPSSKEEKRFIKALEESKDYDKLEDEIRADSLMLELTCPSCNTGNNYWTYLEDYKCNKCGSGLWTTIIKNSGPEYEKILKKREKIYSFYNKLTPKIKRKLRKFKVSTFLK